MTEIKQNIFAVEYEIDIAKPRHVIIEADGQTVFSGPLEGCLVVAASPRLGPADIMITMEGKFLYADESVRAAIACGPRVIFPAGADEKKEEQATQLAMRVERFDD